MKICAGIILYNPNIERLKECIRAVQPQVDKLVIVDNASDNIDEIKKEVLAVSIEQNDEIGYSKEWNVNGENVVFSVDKVK